MKNMSRREVCVSLPVLAAMGAGAPEALALQKNSGAGKTSAASESLASSRAFDFGEMGVRTMANGGESRDIVHGTLATGETVSLHQSMQVAESEPNPLHTIEHSEFILVREGELEFQHVGANGTVSEHVGPGGVFYVAYGTKHTVKNVGGLAASYFVVAIGGDAK
jgi:mannose-6-phosphate isomerase-like protein (cupin superfamily)